MTLTDFLLARFADDEAVARAAAEHRLSLASHPELVLHLSADGPAGERWTCRYDTVNATHDDGGRAGGIAYVGNFGRDLVAHIARHDPARVLAECEAKRRIVERCDAVELPRDAPVVARTAWDAFNVLNRATLRDLASVYSDHADYDPRWAM